MEKEVLVELGVLLASEVLPETHSQALKSESGPRSQDSAERRSRQSIGPHTQPCGSSHMLHVQEKGSTRCIQIISNAREFPRNCQRQSIIGRLLAQEEMSSKSKMQEGPSQSMDVSHSCSHLEEF